MVKDDALIDEGKGSALGHEMSTRELLKPTLVRLC